METDDRPGGRNGQDEKLSEVGEVLRDTQTEGERRRRRENEESRHEGRKE